MHGIAHSGLKVGSKLKGLEHIQNAQAEGKGVLLLGTHSTLLDAGGYLCAQFFDPDVVYRPQNNPLLDMLIVRCRATIYANQIDHDDMRGLIRNLKNGHAIWYSPDQDFGLKQGVMAPFFGTPAATVTAHRRLLKICESRWRFHCIFTVKVILQIHAIMS